MVFSKSTPLKEGKYCISNGNYHLPMTGTQIDLAFTLTDWVLADGERSQNEIRGDDI